MKAIIHIGTEKTGSTSIQAFLARNEALLHEQGVALLKSPAEKNNWKLATYSMDSEFVDDLVVSLGIETAEQRQQWREVFRQALVEELNELGPEVHSVMISSEHLHSRLASEADISRFYALLKGFFTEFRIIVYFRRQDRLATSAQSTAVKAGGEGYLERVRDGQIENDDHFFNPEISLGRWQSVFTEERGATLVPRVYERRHFYKQSLLDDFIHSTQVLSETLEYEVPPRRNASLSAEALEAVRSFNARFPSKGSDAKARQHTQMRLQLVKKLEEDHPGTPNVLTRAEAENFYACFKAANDRVARQWFGRETLFDEDFSQYPESLDATLVNRSLVDSIMAFLDKALTMEPGKFAAVNVADERGSVLRDLALQCEKTDPEVACLLMEEARRYQPQDPDIESKLEKYRSRGVARVPMPARPGRLKALLDALRDWGH